LGWNYEKWKYILPFNRLENEKNLESNVRENTDNRNFFSRYSIRSLYARFRAFLKQLFSDKFPFKFAAGVFGAMVFFVLVVPRLYSVKPRNDFQKCITQFKNTKRIGAGENFCSCIHNRGEPLNKCLNEYENAPEDINQTP
jgi:hypothetical protein